MFSSGLCYHTYTEGVVCTVAHTSDGSTCPDWGPTIHSLAVPCEYCTAHLPCLLTLLIQQLCLHQLATAKKCCATNHPQSQWFKRTIIYFHSHVWGLLVQDQFG